MHNGRKAYSRQILLSITVGRRCDRCLAVLKNSIGISEWISNVSNRTDSLALTKRRGKIRIRLDITCIRTYTCM